VYYRCNRHAGRSTCNEKHVREEALAEGLASLCESMSIYKPQLDKKLTKEVDKINEIQKMIHADNAKIITKKEYLNFIFTN
jgi:flagellar hook-associated protein FlgK